MPYSRSVIENALAKPHTYIGSIEVADDDKDKIAKQNPLLSIAYILYRESGSLINIYDYWRAFHQSLTGGGIVGKGFDRLKETNPIRNLIQDTEIFTEPADALVNESMKESYNNEAESGMDTDEDEDEEKENETARLDEDMTKNKMLEEKTSVVETKNTNSFLDDLQIAEDEKKTLAWFYKVIAELKFLGFVKATMARKGSNRNGKELVSVAVLQKLAWEGL